MKLLFPIARFLPGFLVVLFLLPYSVKAQRNLEDVVYLKNGGVLRGSLLPQDSVGIIRIEILGKNVLAFHVSEVQSITREPVVKHSYGAERPGISYKKRGYYNLSQVGLSIGGVYYNSFGYEEGNRANPGLQFINGYQFHRFIAAGVGAGVDLFPQGPMLPVFLDLRGDVLQKPVTPHFFGQVGYNQPLYNLEENDWQTDTRVEGGLMYAAGVGMKFHLPGSLALLFTMGYRSQEVTESLSYLSGDRISRKVTYQRISMQMGLMF